MLARKLFMSVRDIPIIESYSEGAEITSNTLVINKPTNIVSGDLLVAIIGASSGDETWSGDTDWTEDVDLVFQPGLRVAHKTASGSEPASYTFTRTGSSASLDGVVLCIKRGVWDAIGAIGTSAVPDPCVAPAIISAGGLLLAAYFNRLGSSTFSTPPNMVSVISDSGAIGPSSNIFRQSTYPGSTGSRSSTPDSLPTDVAGVLISIRSA